MEEGRSVFKIVAVDIDIAKMTTDQAEMKITTKTYQDGNDVKLQGVSSIKEMSYLWHAKFMILARKYKDKRLIISKCKAKTIKI